MAVCVRGWVSCISTSGVRKAEVVGELRVSFRVKLRSSSFVRVFHRYADVAVRAPAPN